MSPKLTQQINSYLQSKEALSIIDSSDFYFQKAQDTLKEFLKYEISEEQKSYLIKNLKEYEELKQTFENLEELLDFGKLLFGVISYCDAKAYKKSSFNQYPDKRVLALAFVRMNNWVEQLLSYKFGLPVPKGSVINAIHYLLNPEENFTMLSENHRAQMSENLFKKSYNPITFKGDVYDYYSEQIPSLVNAKNQSHLLSRFCYEISPAWKINVIGLISPDSTGWQASAINDTNDGSCIALWNHKKPNGTNETLKRLRQCIEDNGFFKIFYTSSYNVNYVAEIVDFVSNQNELDKSAWIEKYGNIKWFSEKFTNYNDGKKQASWIYLAKKIYKVTAENYLDFKYHGSYGYPSVGCQAPVISYKSKNDLQIQKQMDNNINLIKYKKQIILQGPPGTGKTRLAKEIANKLLTENQMDSETIDFKHLTPAYIKANLKVEQKIKGKNGKEFEILSLLKNVVVLKSDISKPWKPSYNKIIDSFNNRFWSKKGRTGGYKPYEDAVAKYFFDNHLDFIETSEQKLIKEDDFSLLVQFHPSYTYEDFVRGIIAKPNEDGEGILYEAADKTLAELAEKAINDPDNNYVLIIDEINRANLSSVLGELIYALEYRGEVVESMYAIDGDNKLILPPNLYIIGTMNTADRSVGHIDYAIRRRFAFVDVLPKELKDESIQFQTALFKLVSELFITNYDEYINNNAVQLTRSTHLSGEFDPKDVWIGHSYFIQKKLEGGDLDPQDFSIRLQFEIVPILREYVKDGILNNDDKTIEKITEIENFKVS